MFFLGNRIIPGSDRPAAEQNIDLKQKFTVLKLFTQLLNILFTRSDPRGIRPLPVSVVPPVARGVAHLVTVRIRQGLKRAISYIKNDLSNFFLKKIRMVIV